MQMVERPNIVLVTQESQESQDTIPKLLEDMDILITMEEGESISSNKKSNVIKPIEKMKVTLITIQKMKTYFI